MKKHNKIILTILSIFTLSIASIFAAEGKESRPFKLEIYGALSDSEPQINIKYNSSYLVESQKINVFDFGNPSKQFTDDFSIIVSAYDIKKPKILNCEISIGPFILYNDTGTTVRDTGETPNITLIEKNNHTLTPGDPFSSSDKAFSVVLPSGYYSKSEYTFANFKFDITPGLKNYIAGTYISTITFSISVN
jgi:hypothetical protein